MPHEKLRPHFAFDEERLKELKRIAPEAFADGEVNWDTLKESLGDYLEEDGLDSEHFGLFWPGKKQARKLASLPSKGTLVPLSGAGIDEENTHNIFIEGENLEVLKLLQKSYAGRIKMIYIDPPYNTGNDFVYEDDFKEPLEEYLRRTGQLDEDGKPLSTNAKADGRFHSKWLSMIYPRLRLARNLLQDDGIIFVSIDDNEVHNLREVMNEIFGEENFIGEIVPIVNPGGRDYLKIAQTHEYILVYGISNETEINELNKGTEEFEHEDELGKYTLRELRNRNPKFHRGNRPNLFYPFYVASDLKDDTGCCAISLEKTHKYNVEVVPKNSKDEDSVWRWGKPLSLKNIVENDPIKSQIVAREKKKGGWNIYEKNRKSTTKIKSVWDETEMRTENGTRRIRELFGFTAFDHPKPVDLIKRIISLSVDDEEIILDFFGGSGTTADALYSFKKDTEKNISFIIVQSAEIIDSSKETFKKGFKTVSELCLNRIKLSSANFNNKNDKGVKAFKLSTSSFKQWKNYEGGNIKELEKQFEMFSTPLVSEWKEENLLNEILLIEGFPLDSSIELLKGYKKNKLCQVTSGFCEHRLLICLDKKISDDTISNLKLEDTDIFICLDTAITDQDKARLSDKGLLKTI